MAKQHFQTVNQENCLSSNTLNRRELGTVNEEDNGEYDALFIADLLEHMQINKIPQEKLREEAEKMLAA